MSQVDIVILQWNHWQTTARLIDSIRATCGHLDYRIVLVDNGSDLIDRKRIAQRLAENDTIVHLAENAGYAGGVNAGLRMTDAPFVLLQNNDTLLYPGSLDRLLHHAQGAEVGAVGPLCNPNESDQSLAYQPDAAAALKYTDEPYWEVLASEFDRCSVDVRMLASFSMLLTRAAITDVGPFSLEFGEGYGDDDDYCIRLRRAGYRLLLAYDAYVHHDQRVTHRARIGDDGIEAEGQQGLAKLRELYGSETG